MFIYINKIYKNLLYHVKKLDVFETMQVTQWSTETIQQIWDDWHITDCHRIYGNDTRNQQDEEIERTKWIAEVDQAMEEKNLREELNIEYRKCQ